MWGFSFLRWWGIVVKEFLQLRRDRMTLGMVVGIPIVQLLLFGYAINTDPKHLPTALIFGEQTSFTRSLESSLRNSEYFDIITTIDERGARDALKKGTMHFIVSVPPDFSRKLFRGERPSLLVEADATDPMAAMGAIASLQGMAQSIAQKELEGVTAWEEGQSAFSIITHKLYNPEGLTHYNIIPGLLGMILTMTTIMMTSLAITRERERGTMENLLSSPTKPLEILTGKIFPYILIGHIQAGLVILLAIFLFGVPFNGNPFALYLATLLFIAGNLTVGVAISSIAGNQLQALQMTIFFILPNLMLSGFMFPFAGMPKWAQCIGNILPLTHFNRAVRGILLKGNGWEELWATIWPVIVFCVVAMFIATRFFKKTLD